MAEQLTPEQRMAVENRGGKLLVSAAAGSGKTKVLVDRLMKYILDPVSPCNIDDFLMITYTKAAAAELRGKIAAKLSEHLAADPDNRHLQKQMQRLYLAKISTVHAYCTDLLRQNANRLDLPPDFRVGDESECGQLRSLAMEELLDEAYAAWMEDGDFRAFVDTQGLGRDDRLVPVIVEKVYDAARCHLDPEHWLDHCVRSADVIGATDAAQTVWGAYLLADLHRELDMQICAMKRCAELARQNGTIPKVESLLEQTVVALEFLNEAKAWDEVVARRDVNYGRMTFPRKMEDLELKERIQAVREGCKDSLGKKLKVFCDPSEAVLQDLSQTGSAIRGLVKLARAFGERYSALKQRRRVLDFSDLEHRSLDLLLGKSRSVPTALAREEGQRFREVLVDEYQDSNAVQDAIFGSLTAEKQNCFLVGDVKQSIYRFRLADPGIFLEKYATYVPAEDAAQGQGRKILLSRNFRSGGAVLEATNDVFYRCMSERVGDLNYTEAEALVEGIPHEPLGEPEVELHVLTSDDVYHQEPGYVADRIAELLDGSHLIRGKDGLRPIEAEDIAILLRSPGSVGQHFQDALASRGIRSAFGGGRDLLQTGEIGTLRALLQVLSNPRQDIPLIAVLSSPLFGFTADDLARIRARQKHGDFYEALLLEDGPKTAAFLEILDRLRACARQMPLARLLEEIFCITRMDSIYAAMDGGVERTVNLREFYRLALEFEAAARRDLSQFLEHLELMEQKGLTIQEPPTAGAVQILSIHKSKGLEYPVVFLSGLSRSFNTEDLKAQVLCDGELGLGLSAVDRENRVRYPTIAKRAIVARTSGESLSEELRVLYVAMTRARDRLIMTYADKKPEKTLAAIANRLELGGAELLASQVSCPGQWVLMEAMTRSEAGALFALSDARPAQTHMSDHPWKIVTAVCASAEADALPQEEPTRAAMPPETVELLRRQLSFRYPYEAATVTPSKQTATQLKGRDKDDEVRENAQTEPKQRTWRRFGEVRTHRGADYGVAMHTLMQYVRFDCCTDLEGLEAEIRRLSDARVIPAELAPRLDRSAILAFFRTEPGKKLMTGKYIREFKFSILEDADSYGEGLSGEQILLQGVVDCALVDEDGITVIDFKTDYVTDATLPEVLARYRPQVDTYSRALERIYEMPVKGTYLYFFHLKKLIAV